MNGVQQAIIDLQLQAMTQLVHEERERRCQAILDQARQEAQELLATAEREAKQRVKSAIREERARLKQALRTARAKQTTAIRNRQLTAAKTMLIQARGLLPRILVERWRTPTARHAWIRALHRQARALLPHGEWSVHHPADWPPTEWLALAMEPEPMPVRFQADGSIPAGLRICHLGTCLDSTPAGLLADQTALDAMLLALLNRGEMRP